MGSYIQNSLKDMEHWKMASFCFIELGTLEHGINLFHRTMALIQVSK